MMRNTGSNHTLRTRLMAGVMAATLAGFHGGAGAEDIDLFVQPALQSGASDLPNVLIVVDNTGNWSSPFNIEKSVLSNLFLNLKPASGQLAKFRVGVMFATETGSSDSSVNGGYVRAAIRTMDATNATIYSTMFSSLDSNADKGNSGASGVAMAEAYRYFSGGNAYSGNNKAKTDYKGNTGADWSNSVTTTQNKPAMQAVYALAGNALDSKSATKYNSPIPTGYCGKNYLIYISNGPNQQSASLDTQANNMLAADGGDTAQISISPSGSASNPSDEWARFMWTKLGIITYAVDINPTTSGQGPGWTALLKSMTIPSSGKYFAVQSGTDGSQITLALNEIFSEIQAVNTVFASVSLPVSVNTEGTYLNQVFIGMFRPDADGFPRWKGNLKQYKLGYEATDTQKQYLKLLDGDGDLAINPSTGFLTSCARSYWTPTSADTYWSKQPSGTCKEAPDLDMSNYPDGEVVEKGGQAYILRSSTTRTVKTCASSCTAMVDFNNTVVSQSDLGAASTTERDTLINWAKGLDTDDEDIDGVTTTEMRRSAHGDVVHSRPVAVNYGTEASPRVVVFYGANDGMVRAINGNRTDAISGYAAGQELWSFMPREALPNVKRIRDNSLQINFFGNPNASAPKPYGFDGPMSAYKGTSNVWLYATMRRGGRSVYAFDVSTPQSPTLKWRIGCPSQTGTTGCTSNMAEVGQTWSTPKPFFASGYSSGSAPLLLMGGGYDPACEDADPHTCSASGYTKKGNRIYVLDANDGSVQKAFTTDRAVVADIFIVNDPTTNRIKWAYAADLGGNIYRIGSGTNTNAPMGSTSPGSWTMVKIASLGSELKFFSNVDVVEDSGGFYAILVGSGDREKPLRGYTAAYGISNYFFMVKDKPLDSSWLTSENATCSGNFMCKGSLVAIAAPTNCVLNSTKTQETCDWPAAPTQSSVDAKKGWYMAMRPHEQVVTSAITVFGNTTFSSSTPAEPAANSCTSDLGLARVYNVGYQNGAATNANARSDLIAGGGLPPSPVAGMVKLDDGNYQAFVIGSSASSPLESKIPTIPGFTQQPKGKAFWQIQQ